MTPAETLRAADSRFTLKEYPKILIKRIWILVGVFALGVGTTTVLTFKTTPTYRATATIQIKAPHKGARVLSSGATLLYGVTDSAKYYQTQYMLLQQPSTIRRMVQFKILDSEGRPIEEFKQFRGMTLDEIVRSIVGRIGVSERRSTEIVDISVTGTNPKVLHKVANALVETFMQMQTTNIKKNREDRVSELETKARDAKLKIDTEEVAKKAFFHQHNIEPTIFEARFTENRNRRSRWVAKLDEVQMSLVDLEPVVAAMESAKDEDPEGWVDRLANLPYLRENARIEDLDRQVIVTRAEQLKLLQSRGSGDGEVKRLDLQVAHLQTLIQLERERLLMAVPHLIAAYRTQVKSLETQLTEIELEYEKFAKLKVTYEEFTTSIARAREQKDRFYGYLEELMTGEDMDEDTVRLVEHAAEPRQPVSPNVALNIGLATLLSVLVGIGLVILLEYMDDTLMSKEEVDRLDGSIPFLGVIRSIRASGTSLARSGSRGERGNLQQRDLFAVEQPKSTVAEDFRGVRTALSFGEGLDDDRVFLVTSSSPKEGKTTVAINLATVMAYSGLRTLLIDADLRKPRIHKSFGVTNEIGLTNLIIGRGTPEDCIHDPEIENLENLDLLTSGPIPPNPSELLGRPRLREIMEELTRQYDRVLIDSPPLGAVTDAAVLSRNVDRTIIVVKAGKTKRRLVESAIEQLRVVKARFAGLVLNDLRSTATRYYPGYYQYYYYSSYAYASEDARKKKKGA